MIDYIDNYSFSSPTLNLKPLVKKKNKQIKHNKALYTSRLTILQLVFSWQQTHRVSVTYILGPLGISTEAWFGSDGHASLTANFH